MSVRSAPVARPRQASLADLPPQRLLHVWTGWALMALASACAVAAFHEAGAVSWDGRGQPWLVLGLWVTSVFLLIAAAAAMDSRRFSGVIGAPVRWSEWAALFVVLALGAVLRVVGLDRIPANVSGDEAGLGLFSREVLEGRWHDPFTTGLWSHPTLWFYVQAGALWLFGDDVGGLRLLTALIGVATVAALYLFARRFYGVRIALVATVLLATYHFHIHFSRVGLNQAIEALFMLVGFGVLLIGWQARSPLLLAVAGISIGVAQNFYYGTRLEFVVLIAFIVHQLVVSRQAVVAVARYLPLLCLGLVVGWGPGIRVPLDQWNDYSARLAVAGIFQSGWFESRQAMGESTAEILFHQLVNSAGAFSFTPDRSPNYSPGMPLLDPVASVLFLVGLCVLLARWRRPESGLLLGLLVCTLVFGGVLLTNPPESQRFIGLAPLLCLVIALGLDSLARALSWTFPRARPLVRPLLVVAVAGLALWSTNFYFREYTPRRMFGFGPTETATEMGRFLEQRPGRYVYFFGAPFVYLGDPSIRFIARNPPGVDVLEPLERPGERLGSPSVLSPLVVVHSARLAELGDLRRRYPGTPLRIHRSPVDGRPLFASYEPFSRAWADTGRH